MGWTSQNPSPEVGTSLLYEDDQVKIWDLRLKPGEKSLWHRHRHPYVTVILAPGNLVGEYDKVPKHIFRYRGGEIEVITGPGSRSWIHHVKNISDRPWRNLVIEFKGDLIPTSDPGEIRPLTPEEDQWRSGLNGADLPPAGHLKNK